MIQFTQQLEGKFLSELQFFAEEIAIQRGIFGELDAT